MRRGVPRIVQAALRSGDERWFGYADVLRRVHAPSTNLGAWSYEALDTKLSRETKGATILQLSLYSDILAEIQGRAPEYFFVVTPVRALRALSAKIIEHWETGFGSTYNATRKEALALVQAGKASIPILI
jgi:hypothetical protein